MFAKGANIMELDYSEIGKRIARRRKELGLKQAEVCERAGINGKYLSCIVIISKYNLKCSRTPKGFPFFLLSSMENPWGYFIAP